MLVVAATERELAHVRGAEIFVCGLGPVEAALRTARALTELRPAAVLHIGVAGARGIDPLSLVVGSEAVYCDLLDPANTQARVERVEPDRELLARVRAALPEAIALPIATSARVGGGSAFQVEAMEGFGVLRACELAGVAAVELRAISNSPDEADRSRWQIDAALGVLAAAVARVLA